MWTLKWKVFLMVGLLGAAACVRSPTPPTAAGEPRANEMRVKTQALTIQTPGAEHEAVLTLPGDAGPHPAIMLVHGGGCTDVDCAVGPSDYPWAKHLAERLAEKGIGLLRYYRAPSDSLEWDLQVAESGWDVLTSHPAIDTEKCVILGHSEGSWQATLLVSKMQQEPSWTQPSLLIETGIFGGDLMTAIEEVFRAVDAPLIQLAESQRSVNPDTLKQYATAWHLELDDIVDANGAITTLKLNQHRQQILNDIKEMLPNNKRLGSWIGVPTNAEAILDVADLPIALIVGDRDQETPPEQAQLVLAALERENPNHAAHLYELAGHNHYLTLLSDDPLDTRFGPISNQAIELIARLVHAHAISPQPHVDDKP